MAQQEKQVLLVDLCARLPYRVIIDYAYNTFKNGLKEGKSVLLTCNILDIFISPRMNETNEYIKPYLRPMSSMTEEELTELAYKVFQQPDIDIIRRWVFENKLYPYIDGNPVMVIDWLNAHYFDYRGLIEKSLALEAPEGMYEIQN